MPQKGLTGEMNLQIKCLLPKREGLSSDPSTHVKSWEWWCHGQVLLYDRLPGRGRQGGPVCMLGLVYFTRSAPSMFLYSPSVVLTLDVSGVPPKIGQRGGPRSEWMALSQRECWLASGYKRRLASFREQTVSRS